MLTARRENQLVDAAQQRSSHELEEIGYNRAHDRVQMLANIDVADEASLAKSACGDGEAPSVASTT
jgi:hypothetical protein